MEWHVMLAIAGLTYFVVYWVLGFVLAVGRKLHDRPHFVFNRMDNVMAVCSVTDFERVLSRLEKDTPLVLVRDILTFSDKPRPTGGAHAGRLSDVRAWEFADARMLRTDRRLFVPFVSEAVWSFNSQIVLFSTHLTSIIGTPSDAELRAWVERHKAENIAASRSRRLGERIEKARGKLEGYKGGSLMAGILFLAAAAIAYLPAKERKDNERPSVFYSTDTAGAVTEKRGTAEELHGLPMHDDMSVMNEGLVSDVQPIGGGLSAVCIRRVSDNERLCGFAADALGLRIGDVGHARYTRIRTSGTVHGDYIHWFIGAREVRALQERGYVPNR